MNVPEDLKELFDEASVHNNSGMSKLIRVDEVVKILEGYELPKCKDTDSESLLED